jgi:outer membrane murein-binding lipoprotein Lpp
MTMKRLLLAAVLAGILAGCTSGARTETPADVILDVKEDATTNVERLNQRTDDIQSRPN